jgi:hypothetical protein
MQGGSFEVRDITACIQEVRPNPWGWFPNGSRDFAVRLKATLDTLPPVDWRNASQQSEVYARIAAYALSDQFFAGEPTWIEQILVVEEFTLLLGRRALGARPELLATKDFMSRAMAGTQAECMAATFQQKIRMIGETLLNADLWDAMTNEVPDPIPGAADSSTAEILSLSLTRAAHPLSEFESVDEYVPVGNWNDAQLFFDAELLLPFLCEMQTYLEDFLFRHGTPARFGPGGAIGWLMAEIETLLPDFIRIGHRILTCSEFDAILQSASMVAPDELWLLCDRENPCALNQLATFLASHVPIAEVTLPPAEALVVA